MAFKIHPVTAGEKEWVLEVVRGWGADFIVSRGRKIYPTELDAFYAEDESGEKVGLITCEIIGDQCEIVTLDAFVKFKGIGTALIERVKETVKAHGCRRLWLITLNDNIDAIRFYQRRDFTIAAIHLNAMVISRRIKPTIPEIGMHGIPIRDEIEFEMFLD